jgi:ABC-2 type transport system permease protein
MGYEPYSREIFGNKAFILNCIEYLLDDENLLEARNKEIKVRLLDAKKAKQEAGKWQLINLIVPFLFVVIFAIIYRYVRLRKWSKIAQ